MSIPDLRDFHADIPSAFVTQLRGRDSDGGPNGDAWLRGLPSLAREMADEWELRAIGPVRFGTSALVVPVEQSGQQAALKLGWPHRESEQEHVALRAWDGDGAVRLLAARPRKQALLLELLDADRSLSHVPIIDACETIGQLMRQLDRPAPANIRPLASEVERWLETLSQGHPGVPRRMTEQAAAWVKELASTASSRLVHQDLHFDNVLAGERAPWLAIDAKPLAAPWEFAVAPVLWNRSDEIAQAHNARSHLRFRLGLVCDAAELDEDLAREWSFVRVVLNAVWAQQADHPDHDFVSTMLVVAKAMSDR